MSENGHSLFSIGHFLFSSCNYSEVARSYFLNELKSVVSYQLSVTNETDNRQLKKHLLDTLSDEHLIKKVQEGDHSRLGLLYERYHKDLYAYFFRCTSDMAKSEDLVQNVFFKVLKNSHQYAGKSKFVYWLFTIARNMQINDYRKRDPLRNSYEINDLDGLNFSSNPSETLEKSEDKRLLAIALNQLSPEKKEAIILSRYQGMKYYEIAEIAGCKESAIKSRIQRGLMELRVIMERLQ